MRQANEQPLRHYVTWVRLGQYMSWPQGLGYFIHMRTYPGIYIQRVCTVYDYMYTMCLSYKGNPISRMLAECIYFTV